MNDCHDPETGQFCEDASSLGIEIDTPARKGGRIEADILSGYKPKYKGAKKSILWHFHGMTGVKETGPMHLYNEVLVDRREKRNMNDCHAEDGKFCEGGGSGGGGSSKGSGGSSRSMPKSGSGASRPSVAIKREGKSWAMPDGNPLPKHLDGLKIPPAWAEVQVNPDPEGNLLVTGRDGKGRVQYVYSPKFMETQKAEKFARISALDKEFDEIKDINETNRLDPGKREEADCMRVIMETGIRPGSDRDTKAVKQAYGATTLRGEHVKETDTGVRLQYTGKKGVSLDIPVDNPETAAMLISRAEAAGADGRLFDTDSHTLLQYTHTLGSGQFKVKDMRTYVGTSLAKDEIKRMPAPTTKTAYRKAVNSVADVVSKKLGNTRSMALKAYIAPEVFEAWNKEGAFSNAKSEREPLFDFGIMVGTACRLREQPVDTTVVDDIDPNGDDEDGPCPPDVRMALGFDPDDDEDKSNATTCVGDHCFFGNSAEIAPSEHIAVLQGLNEWVDYSRPTGPQRFYYGADDFRGTEAGLLTTPVIFAQQHPAHRLVARDLDAALSSVRAHDGGPGRVAGRIQTPLIVGNAKPDLMAEVVFDDPYVQRMHAENRLALSTGFTAGHDDDGHLTEAVKWNHLLVFVKDEKNQPRDPATGFLNKEGDDMTDEIDEGAGDKSKPKPPAKPDEGSTDSRLKALIADLLVRLDEVFSSAEQLSDEAGDEGDPDPAVSGKGKAPEEDEEEEPVKRNMNENHDEMGRFTSGGGSSGGAKSVGKSVARKLGNRPSNPSGLSDENHAIARDLAKIVEEDVRNGADAETAVSDALATFDSHSVADGGDELSDKAFLAMLPKEISSQVGAPRSESAGGTFPAVKSALESALPGKSIQVMPKGKGHSGELPPIKIDGETYITNGNEGFDDFQSRLLASEGWKKKGAIRIPTGKKWAVYMPKSHFDRLEQEYLDRLKSNQADLSNADYSWDDCIEEQLAKGYDQAKAEKICGYIKAKNNLQEMRVGRSLAGSDPEEDIMGAEMDALKSELDAANQKLAAVAQAEKDAAWENMKSSHVPKGWLAGATDEEKANKEKALRQEFEQAPVGFANKILDLAKGRGGQDKSKEEGAAFGNKDGDANDVLSVTRELRASSGRR